MTPEDRKTLAEQLDANPLWHEILQQIGTSAIETLVHASNEQDRVEAQWRVRSARAFRSDCQEALASTRRRTGAPA